ncbi:MAG: 16S rRNA processing protein RimM [Chloroflexi bacterium]|nr:16S rRNA processing protein RimM [Chloroflexota bacterium]
MPTQSDPPTGAPGQQSSFLIVARVVRAHGTTGELSCEIVTEFPRRFRRTKTVYLGPEQGRPEPSTPDHGPSETPRPYAVQQARVAPRGHGQQLLLKVEGIDDREAAERLRGVAVQVPESEAWQLPRGRFYWHQIVGLRVVTVDGRELGMVKEILETGANDVYVVQTEQGELLLPAIKDVVKEIAPERGVMLVELLPGMESGERGKAND